LRSFKFSSLAVGYDEIALEEELNKSYPFSHMI